MLPIKLILLCQLLHLTYHCVVSVKIGVSRPLGTSTTTLTPPTTTTFDINAEENITSSSSEFANSTKSIETDEKEWPEFPPRKNTTPKPTTTTRPTTTTPRTTSTVSVPTTEANDMANNKSLKSFNTLAVSIQTWPNIKYCFCDMTFHSCDINCCCDPDCTPESIRVFQCLQEELYDFELHEGRFEDFKFQHGLPSCEVNDGWLCVFRTNISPVEEKVLPISSDTSQYIKWPNMLRDNVEKTEYIKWPTMLRDNVEKAYRDYYIYGDILNVFNVETRDVRSFDLPASLKPPQCHGKEPLAYLRSIKITCLIQSKDKLVEIEQNLVELQVKHKILTKPTILEELQNNQTVHSKVANMTLRWCNENSEKICRHLNQQNKADFVEGNGTEFKKIQFHVFHNFSHLQGLVIDMWHIQTEHDSSDFWLDYEVLFHNSTSKALGESHIAKEAVKTTSGPLGYQLGKPLIISKYLPLNESLPLSDKNQIIEYFSLNHLDRAHTLSLFWKHRGLCERSINANNEFISYGINLSKHCKIRLDNETLLDELQPVKINFTKICLKLQHLTQHHLWGDDLDSLDHNSYFISELGKPKNLTDKWLPLNVVNADSNQVYGQYLESSHSFVCRNILLSLNYEFYVGAYDLPEAAAQKLIKHARLNMGERHDLEFGFDEVIEVPITLTVRFYDINEISGAGSSRLTLWWMVYLISLTLIFKVHEYFI